MNRTLVAENLGRRLSSVAVFEIENGRFVEKDYVETTINWVNKVFLVWKNAR